MLYLPKFYAYETTFRNEIILFIFHIYHCCIAYVASNSPYDTLFKRKDRSGTDLVLVCYRCARYFPASYSSSNGNT